MIDFRKLIKAGVHFGHMTSRWCPKMKPYIWGYKNKIHLIDVSKTAYQLERAAQFLKSVVAEGKQVLFLGTKKSAQEIIQKVAVECNMPYVNHRWIGGTLSNNGQVKKSVTKLLHFEDIVNRADKFPHYTKKELNEFQKNIQRLEKCVGGIRSMRWPLAAIVMVDVTKEHSALSEAVRMGIPVVALIDTNGDPSLVDYVIPANDDAPQSIEIIMQYLKDAVLEGKSVATQREEESITSEQDVTEQELAGDKESKRAKGMRKSFKRKIEEEQPEVPSIEDLTTFAEGTIFTASSEDEDK